MLFQPLDRDGPKRPDAHVQGHKRLSNSRLLAPREQFRGEVQAGGRGGDRARDAGVDRLVTLEICRPRRLPLHVRRQGHRAIVGQRSERGPRWFGSGQPKTPGFLGHQPQPKLAGGRPGRIGQRTAGPGLELQALARLETSPRASHQPPVASRGFPQEEPLPAAAGLRAVAPQPGGEHARVVEDQLVARAEQAGEVGDVVVRPVARGAIDHQQAGLVAAIGRLAGDQPLG